MLGQDLMGNHYNGHAGKTKIYFQRGRVRTFDIIYFSLWLPVPVSTVPPFAIQMS